MGRHGLVLVHGGSHDGSCWNPTVSELRRHAPDLPALAVDLPGRGSCPGDLMSYSIDGAIDAVVAQTEAAGLDQVVLVGHSAAGLVLPGVAARLGASRVSRLVFIAASVPPAGGCVLDTLSLPARLTALLVMALFGRTPKPIPPRLARRLFCNGMSAEQSEFALAHLRPEIPRAAALRVSQVDLPPTIPRTWVLPSYDRAVSPAQQRASIERLGGVDDLVEIDSGHDVMIAEPGKLAAFLAAVCGSWSIRGSVPAL